MKKNPLIVFTGLAIAAIAAVLGVTKDRWMGQAPQAVTETAPAPAPAAPATPAVATETGNSATGQPAASETAAAPAATAQPAPAAPAATAEAPATPAASPAAAKPTFDTVRVEKTGEAVIAGRATAGSDVVVMLDGQKIGQATANADGAFVVVPDQALPEGSGSLTIEAKGAADAAAVKSDQSVAVIVPAGQKQVPLVAVISPDAPTKVLQKPSAETQVAEATPAPAAAAPGGEVSLDAIDYDGAGNIVFIGKATKGAVVRLYVDDGLLADAVAGDTGNWTYTATAPMAAGNHKLRADALDAAGKVTSRVEVPFVREDQTKLAQAGQGEAQQPAAGTGGSTAPAATAETEPKAGRVVIQPGNNLWRIARVIYGTGTKFTVIYEANKDLIKNPNRIYPGQVFSTPNVVPPEQIDPKRRDQLKPEETGAAGQ